MSDNNKSLLLYDSAKARDHATFKRTKIIIAQTETGKVVFEGENKVIIAGSEFTARRHFVLPGTELTPTYNQVLNLEGSNLGGSPASMDDVKTFLFAVGTDGCGELPSQVYEVDTTKWIQPEALVPFLVLDPDDDKTVDRTKYFGRNLRDFEVNGDIYNKVVYYFKAFEHDPVLHRQYADTSQITNNVYNEPRLSEAEIFVELKLQITKDECREFFYHTNGINSARINTISLLYCWPYRDGDYTYYQDIRPLTKYNFPNETLIEPSKGLDITYQIYY